MQKRIIVANWKMNPLGPKEAQKLFTGVVKFLSAVKRTEIVVCPPCIYFDKLKKLSRKISLGAQDAAPGDVGPFTGEVSADMLYEIGVRYVIVGHSERRAMGENNNIINKKMKGALAAGLVPILCVGEDVRDSEHGYFNVVKTELEECLAGISKNLVGRIIIAYEPIWAISSTPGRRDATPEDSREMAIFIRKILSDKFGSFAKSTRILYGGSVNDKDAAGFLSEGGVDGLLVGKASLDVVKFGQIVKICEASKK